MFVVSGAIRENREFWWDELERVVFEPNQPRNTDSPAAGHEPYAQLYTLLFSLMPDERRTMMNDLIEQSGLTSCARATHRPLSCAELVELSRSPVITIGAHTVSHPVLSGMPAGEQAEEVLQSKAELELLTGKPVLQFSYPYGKRGHYNTETMNIVRSAGFQYGFANEAGIATRSSDALQIPRVVVPALDGPEFSRWLSHCLATLP
jgi:peptidoglycan/xylan/chitin deacetylase (PgdA/CDA1 family)